ncbi:hypothetical protein DL765_010100 [Monosporascus sp. GIB2]|nr:hypothetical protein DL765_010100 [Monosporascus sp. GIB2]
MTGQSPLSNRDSSRGPREASNEVQYPPITSSTVIPPNFGVTQCWSARMTNPLPMQPLAPLEGIENLHPGLVPVLGHPQAQATLGVGVHLTSIICTDLQPGKTKQRMCLQYAMWTLAASLSSQFQLIRSDLYKAARQLLDSLETDGQDNQTYPYCFSIEQVQAWVLLAMYELTSDTCNYQRGMVSAGRAFRLVQLMRLYEIDGPDHLTTNSQGQDQGDWIDVESMRRTFWLAYTIDRFTSVIDGLPLSFNERQIRTRLPAPDSNFTSGRPTIMCFLSDMINGVDPAGPSDNVSPFTESIIVATICGRALEHKQRSLVVHQQHVHLHPSDRNRDATYEFCRRHRALNTLVMQRIKMLSMHVSSTPEHPDPILVYVVLAAYMAVFMLCETIESGPLGTEAQAVADALLMEHNQRSLDAVHALGPLIATLEQLNHFQGLTNLNGLAQNFLRLLGLELGDPR